MASSRQLVFDEILSSLIMASFKTPAYFAEAVFLIMLEQAAKNTVLSEVTLTTIFIV